MRTTKQMLNNKFKELSNLLNDKSIIFHDNGNGFYSIIRKENGIVERVFNFAGQLDMTAREIYIFMCGAVDALKMVQPKPVQPETPLPINIKFVKATATGDVFGLITTNNGYHVNPLYEHSAETNKCLRRLVPDVYTFLFSTRKATENEYKELLAFIKGKYDADQEFNIL